MRRAAPALSQGAPRPRPSRRGGPGSGHRSGGAGRGPGRAPLRPDPDRRPAIGRGRPAGRAWRPRSARRRRRGSRPGPAPGRRRGRRRPRAGPPAPGSSTGAFEALFHRATSCMTTRRLRISPSRRSSAGSGTAGTAVGSVAGPQAGTASTSSRIGAIRLMPGFYRPRQRLPTAAIDAVFSRCSYNARVPGSRAWSSAALAGAVPRAHGPSPCRPGRPPPGLRRHAPGRGPGLSADRRRCARAGLGRDRRSGFPAYPVRSDRTDVRLESLTYPVRSRQAGLAGGDARRG